MAFEDLVVERVAEGVTKLTMHRPHIRNALSVSLVAELVDALGEAEADAAVRAVVLTGGPEIFSAGADLKEFNELRKSPPRDDPREALWRAIGSFPKPMIAAVNGLALGGGNELAMMADIVVAGKSARFGQPEVNLGLMPGAGGTQRLVRSVGKAQAMRMVLAGVIIDADEALAIGLIAEVTEDAETLDRAIALATLIAAKGPIAVRAAKDSVNHAMEMGLSLGLEYERKVYAGTWATDDLAEGIAAFLEKRKPQFRGR